MGKNTIKLGSTLRKEKILTSNTALDFTSIQQGDFTPVNFDITSSESGNITSLRSDKSHMNEKWP